MVWFFVLWIGSAIVASRLSEEKGQGGGIGAFLGLVLGPLGLLIIALTADNPEGLQRVAIRKGIRPCPACAEFIRREARKCRYCFEEVEPLPAVKLSRTFERVSVLIILGGILFVVFSLSLG